MNPHFMFNALNAIQHFITTNEQRTALRYLSKFSRLIRSILSNAEKENLTLAEEMDLVRRYLELEDLRYDHKFTYEINIGPNIDVHSVSIPALLIQSHVEQAVQQSLIKGAEKGNLSVSVYLQEAYLYCIIEDNGVQRSQEIFIEGKKSLGYHSMVFSYINKKVDIINRDQNQIEISLENIVGGAGTKVKIRLAPTITQLDLSG